MKWAEHVTSVGVKGSAYRVLVEKPEGNSLKDLGVDGRIILN
jgi:hypothetical protein